MPTQSEKPSPADWAPHVARARRSLFGNYKALEQPEQSSAPAAPDVASELSEENPAQGQTLQEGINVALARSFVYRFLAKAFEDPTEQGWRNLVEGECRASLAPAVEVLKLDAPALASAAQCFVERLADGGFESFHSAYLAAFGHAARGRCPLNEIEYGDIKADPLFQPHRLADLAAFYRAFGLEVTADAGERHDHICLELEFMCVLSAKEAYALEHQLDAEELSVCREAQKHFLREHLGRWTPAFARRLARTAGEDALGGLAAFTGALITSECARFGIRPGSEDLLLRPVDEAAETLCASCSAAPMMPGVAPMDGPST